MLQKVSHLPSPKLPSWNIIVGITYGVVMDGIVGGATQHNSRHFAYVIYTMLGGYAVVAFFQVLSYPVGGLIADLWCGGFRVVFFSLFKILCGCLLLCIVGLMYVVYNHHEGSTGTGSRRSSIIVMMGIAFLLLAAGFAGLQVNSVQFGLDQLLDSPSQELSVFIHGHNPLESYWHVCMEQLYHAVLYHLKKCSVPIPYCTVVGILLVLSYYKRDWFHNEPHTNNPYGTVYRVLKYTAKHDKPIRRSAFAYCDDERPTRIDFAKQRFGGPFTTETVEDVKTFLRILLMLFLIAPVFNLHVSTSYIFPLYGIHIGSHPINDHVGCTAEWMLLQSGNLSFIVSPNRSNDLGIN